METGNQAEYAAMRAAMAVATEAASEATHHAANHAAKQAATTIAATAAAHGGGRPDKEQVRRWLLERVASRQPLPEPDAIRRALGWTAVIAAGGSTPETPAAA